MMCEATTKVAQASRLRDERVSASVENKCASALPKRAGETPALLSGWCDATELPLMVNLPTGEFIMGETADDKFITDTERPAHRVNFSHGCALGKFPVTVGEFRQFRPEHAPEEPAALPVVRVSWQDANAYCDWLTEQTGCYYRLPNEAEWEFACRAGSRTPFAGGDEISIAEANFLYDEIGLRVGTGARTPGGSYPANAFGLHDLHGNVCEWVADSWHPNYHGAPSDGRAWIASGDERRVIRGGAWDYLPRLLRSAWRDWRPQNFCADNLGFRVATSDLRAGPKMWRQASLPAVEGGILPPGKTTRSTKRSGLTRPDASASICPPGWKPGSTSAKMADATISRPALKTFSEGAR